MQQLVPVGVALVLSGVCWAESALRGVPYLTLCNLTGEATPETYYGDTRSTLKSGFCEISELGLGFLSAAAKASPFRIPDEILSVESVHPMAETQVLDDLETRASGAAPVLYTHGFFIDFEKGCRRATVFGENIGMQDRFLWFSWPSDGALLNYARDEVDLYWSVPDLAQVIVELEARFGSGQVNLVGHSLGARGTILALYDIAGDRPDLRVGEVVLIAGDIDFGIFRKILPRNRSLAGNITIYTYDADRPLELSGQVHRYPRLGQSGNADETLGRCRGDRHQ